MESPQMKERPSGVVLNTISPESKCPICLDHYKNISYLDVCLHKFCFCCIREWSKNKAECPLCKQPFHSIYHTIKSEDNYKKYDLRPTENGSFGNMGGQRFRYRTTLTGERRPLSRRTSPPPDHGIIFEGLRGSVPQRHSRDLHSMIRRLAVRQRRESEGRSVRSLQEQEVVKFRRALYRRGARVQSVQDGGRSRDTTAEFFRRNPACLHRLVPWLRRELAVLYGAHGSLANIVQHIIMTLITRHNLDDQAVLHELRPFLLTHTEHFLHEFLSFARSPFNMEAYDQRAVYDLPQPSGESSNSDTSVIAISEDESDSLLSGAQDFATPRVTLSQTAWDDETPGPSYSLEPSLDLPVHVRDSDSDSSVGEAVVSNAGVPHQDRPDTNVATATDAVEEEHSSESDEDCVIVGYVKPVAERTPELVQLSSDSEHSEPNTPPQRPQEPQHFHFISDSDLSPTVTPRPLRSSSRSPEDTSAQLRKKDKDDEMHHERELLRSREGSSRSNRTQSSCHSRKQLLPKENKDKKRGEKETSRRTSSYWHSYSHYSDRGRKGYTETHSSYTSYYRSVYDRSRSHSRTRSRDREHRGRSRSNSGIRYSSRRNRSHSRSNSRINSSNRRNRSHSRSNSRINSSNRRNRSHSRSNSRINSSNRRNRSHSRSNSRINSSSRRNRSHSRSNSRINSSSRRNRSHSRSSSRINSKSSRQTSCLDEHGRKRKYKTKHKEESLSKSSSKVLADSSEDVLKNKSRKHHKKFKRKSRSPSIDDKSEGQSRKHHKKKKKKHKRKSKRHNSEEKVGKHSPVLITIASDSDSVDSSEPSTSNICAVSSTVTIANNASENQALKSSLPDMEPQLAAGMESISVDDAGNHPQTD